MPPSIPLDREFDTVLAGELARLETYNKHHYRPNTYMHKWWARRCGSTFRLILKQLVENADDRDYYKSGGLAGKIVLDPMMGGGTTLHEAIRMGASVVGMDIDPIPVLQARATLSKLPLDRLERAFDRLYERLSASMGWVFATVCPSCEEGAQLRFLLYGAQRHCDCGEVLVVDSLTLRYQDGRASVRLCSYCSRLVMGDEPCNCGEEGTRVVLAKGETSCSRCGSEFRERTSTPYFRRYTPVAVVGACKQHGLFFAAPRSTDLKLVARADAERERLGWSAERFAVDPGPKSKDLISRGVNNYLDLFSSRQLLYLHHVSAQLPEFDSLVGLNLAMLVSTSLEFNSMLCGYKGARRGTRPGAIRHTFSYHAYSFPYTALENNVLFPGKASGTLVKLFHDRVRRARRWAQQPRERNLDVFGPRFISILGERDAGEEVSEADSLNEGDRLFLLRQGTAANVPLPDASVDYVVTDPPYFDSVQYSDLATFFRVWLRQLLGPSAAYDTFGSESARWEYDRLQAAVEPRGNGQGQYVTSLTAIFKECRRVLRPEGGRLVFTFHNWKAQGWEALTLALQRASFVLVNRYVVFSEHPISVHIANFRSLTHDAILVLAPAGTVSVPEWRQPDTIDMSESETFTRDCATYLGWLLNQGLDEELVRAHWQEALASERV